MHRYTVSPNTGDKSDVSPQLDVETDVDDDEEGSPQLRLSSCVNYYPFAQTSSELSQSEFQVTQRDPALLTPALSETSSTPRLRHSSVVPGTLSPGESVVSAAGLGIDMVQQQQRLAAGNIPLEMYAAMRHVYPTTTPLSPPYHQPPTMYNPQGRLRPEQQQHRMPNMSEARLQQLSNIDALDLNPLSSLNAHNGTDNLREIQRRVRSKQAMHAPTISRSTPSSPEKKHYTGMSSIAESQPPPSSPSPQKRSTHHTRGLSILDDAANAVFTPIDLNPRLYLHDMATLSAQQISPPAAAAQAQEENILFADWIANEQLDLTSLSTTDWTFQ